MRILTYTFALIVVLPVFFSLVFLSCTGKAPETTLPAAHPAAADISVSWEVVENVFQSLNAFKSQFTFTNNSNVPLGSSDWAFYYNTNRMIEPDSVPDTVQITHINGDFFKLIPTSKFPILTKGKSVTIAYVSAAWAINYTDAPAGGYFVFTGAEGKPLPPDPVREIKVKPFTHERQTRRRADDNVPVSTPQLRYEENLRLKARDKTAVQKIIPTPRCIENKKGVLVMNRQFEIHYASGLESEAAFLGRVLEGVFGGPLKTINCTVLAANAIVLERENLEDIGGGVEAESYRLVIDTANGIRITGGDAAGVFYGIRTLQALLPLSACKEPQEEIRLANCVIQDAPRFAYRGLHLDVARNFQCISTVKKMLDLMAFYKLNKLHFHLTDDEGWRLEIQELPELTQVGAYRGHTEDETGCIYPSFGSGPFKDIERSYGSGYYSRAEFIGILKYAHERKIEVIPEIDVPGHARAAIKAMDERYRRLMEEGKTQEAEEYLLRDLQDASTYRSVQGWNDNTMCVCKESVYRFLETVVDDIREMYAEAGAVLTTVHIGGDEVPKGVWEKSPDCRQLVAVNKNLHGTGQLSAYFISRLNEILKKRGLVTAGWQEIALAHPEKEGGKPEPKPEFADGKVMPYVWNNVWGWGQEDVGNRLANAGYPVVIAYVTNLYFDLAYSKDPDEPGYYWGGFIDTRKAFELTPFDIRKCAGIDLMGNPLDKEKFFKSIELLTEKGKVNLQGIQGHLWSENSKGRCTLEYQAFPKVLGLAERAWAEQPAWARIDDDRQREKELDRAWNRFAHALGKRELPRLDVMVGGVRYRLPLPGAIIEEGVLKANAAFPGLEIRITTDGSEPLHDSTLYKGPVRLGKGVKTVKLKTFSSTGRSSRTSVIEL